MEPGGEAGEIDGDVGEMVVDVIGGEIDRVSDDVGGFPSYIPQNVILLKYLALSPKRFSSEVTPGKSSTLTRFLQNERFVTGDTELQNVRT